MRETAFIDQNKEKWADFEEMLKQGQQEPEALNDLYVQITDDLSYARTFYPNRSVRLYLNSLAQRVFQNVYRGKRFPLGRLRRFWSDELPQVMWETRHALWLSFGLFALAFAIGIISSVINPDFARLVLGEEYVEMTLRNIQSGDPMAVYKREGPLGMTLGIAANNLFVALRTAIFGVLASVGTVFIMLYNGIMVGAFQYFFVEQGVFWQSFLTIWIHGTLEISAIIIAGASGLVAGSGLLFPGTYTRIQAFQRSMRLGIKVFLGVAPIILLAAFFEGFLTRLTDTPDFLRGAFIGASLLFVLWYFVWLPWHKARTGVFAHTTVTRELPPNRDQTVDFSAIKSPGEVISDTFGVLARHSKILVASVGIACVAALGWTYAASEEPIKTTLVFPPQFLGAFLGIRSMFSSETAPLLGYLQTVLFAVLGMAAFKAVEQAMPEAERPNRTLWSRLLVFVLLLIPMAPLALLWWIKIGFGAWIAAMVVAPFCAHWAAALYFDTSNPIMAFLRTLQMFRWGQGFLLGFLLTNLGLLCYVFLDTPIWDMVLNLFSWLVPSGKDYMAIFSAVTTALFAATITYFTVLALLLNGGLFYFSNREIEEANHLRAGIGQVGTGKKIRGLARE